MGTKIYNKLQRFLKEIDDNMAFRKKLKLIFLLQSFYSVEEFIAFLEVISIYDGL
jgi:hypothetical protein